MKLRIILPLLIAAICCLPATVVAIKFDVEKWPDNVDSLPRSSLMDVCTSSGYFSVSFENDLNDIMIPKRREPKDFDRNYTMGLSFSWSNRENSFLAYVRSRITKVFKTQDFYSYDEDEQDTTGNIYHSLGNISHISAAAFTPDDLLAKEILRNDRPYSFLIQTGAMESYINDEFNKLKTFGLNIGLYGTPIGKWVQTTIHRASGGQDFPKGKQPYIPQGWHNQIANKKIVPTFLFTYKADYLLNKRSINPNRKSIISCAYSYEILVGYYTGATFELYGKLGKIDARNWYRKLNNIDDSNKGNKTTGEYFFEKRRKWELFLAFGVKQNAILYNQSLSGGAILGTPYRLVPVKQTRVFITEGLLGVGVTLCTSQKQHKYVEVSWMPFQFRTPEMKRPIIQRNHYWGGINVKFINR